MVAERVSIMVGSRMSVCSGRGVQQGAMMRAVLIRQFRLESCSGLKRRMDIFLLFLRRRWPESVFISLLDSHRTNAMLLLTFSIICYKSVAPDSIRMIGPITSNENDLSGVREIDRRSKTIES
jgi:hypothetical protein